MRMQTQTIVSAQIPKIAKNTASLTGCIPSVPIPRDRILRFSDADFPNGIQERGLKNRRIPMFGHESLLLIGELTGLVERMYPAALIVDPAGMALPDDSVGGPYGDPRHDSAEQDDHHKLSDVIYMQIHAELSW